MTRALLAILAIAALSPANAATVQGEPGPHGHLLPAWLRIVDHDGQVWDMQNLVIDAITLCPTGGAAGLWNDAPFTSGMAIVETAFAEWRIAYEGRYYNTGGVTSNPNTTGDQVVIIEAVDSIFLSGVEDCVRYGFPVTP